MTGESETIVSDDGIAWRVRPWALADDALGHSVHERKLWPIFSSMFSSALKHERAFLDVGAHVGRYTLRAAHVGLDVIAVEPNPASYDTLCANIRLNRFENHVWAFPVAAWSESTTLHWALSPIDERDASGRVAAVPASDHAIAVPGRRLDELLPVARIGCMKVDTEGAEYHALLGASRILHRDRPLILIEMHDRFCPAVDRAGLLQLLDAAHYKFQSVLDYGTQDYLYAEPLDGPCPETTTATR